MGAQVTMWLYRRLGRRYWIVLAGGQALGSILVVDATLIGLMFFLRPSLSDAVLIAAVGSALTVVATVEATLKGRPAYELIAAWDEADDPSEEDTVAAWRAASTLTFRQYRRDSWWVNAMIVVPTLALTIWLLELDGFTSLALVLAIVAPAVWGTFLSYSMAEWLSRPLITDIAESLPHDFPFTHGGFPMQWRLKVGIPAYTIVAGMGVAAVVTGTRGGSGLLVATLVATGVGGILAAELAVLLCRAIIQPLDEIRTAMQQVRTGDYDVRVPVMSGDEIGELAHDFNRMARGLREREELREAFGTYVDKAVVEVILSGQFPPEGVEIEVSLLFCDVRGFTSYSEQSSARDVIALLNELFELTVPIIERHGGHVDKFIGDGLLAVFGAPDFFEDHADRAVAAAAEIVAEVNAGGFPLTVAAGVNSGIVVAGAVGGAGRLNFSVIGDAVNVAARVEAATRSTGDDVLVTEATRARLRRPANLVSRGRLPLKGKSEPQELYALVSSPVGTPRPAATAP